MIEESKRTIHTEPHIKNTVKFNFRKLDLVARVRPTNLDKTPFGAVCTFALVILVVCAIPYYAVYMASLTSTTTTIKMTDQDVVFQFNHNTTIRVEELNETHTDNFTVTIRLVDVTFQIDEYVVNQVSIGGLQFKLPMTYNDVLSYEVGITQFGDQSIYTYTLVSSSRAVCSGRCFRVLMRLSPTTIVVETKPTYGAWGLLMGCGGVFSSIMGIVVGVHKAGIYLWRRKESEPELQLEQVVPATN